MNSAPVPKNQFVDGFGYPVYSGSGGRLIAASRNDPKKGPQIPLVTEGIGRSVSYWDQRVILSSARNLWANFGVLKGATSAKAMHSVGRAWEPEFHGDAKDWGEQAMDWLRGWYQVCDVRGEIFDFKTSLYLDSVATDRDGDFGVLLTETDDGYPQIQHIPAHRIGQRAYSDTLVTDDTPSMVRDTNGDFQLVKGVYQGLRIQSGIIYNDRGRAVAARILGAYRQDDRDVSMRDFIFRFDPEWQDQGRGLSSFSGSIDFIRSSFTSHDWQQRALLIASAIGLIETNESGQADAGDLRTLATTEGATQQTFSTQELEGGLIRYFKTGTGAKLQSFVDGKPGDQWDQFNDRIIRIALEEMNWPYSLCWKPESMTGTQERSAIEKARAAIADRQDLLRPLAKREVGYAISKAIKLGLLPPYPGEDIGGQLNWGFSLPPQFNIDHGREDQQWRENYKIGVETMAGKLRQDGKNGDILKHWTARAEEAAQKQRAIAAVEKKYGITIDSREIQMLNPNELAPTPDDSTDAAPAPAPSASKPAKKP